MRKGKIVFRPPERCYTNVRLEETEHGWKVYNNSTQATSFIPHSAVVEVSFKE
jgi:lauroyl/myristoyl acyltransferase|tara:strand:+ start:1108 stop:1266 length:159 start_codon:yes stop_codon:yes gene_type:complete